MASFSDCPPLKSLLGLSPNSWARLESALVRIGGLSLTREQLSKNEFTEEGLLAEDRVGDGGLTEADGSLYRDGITKESARGSGGFFGKSDLVLETLKILRSVLIESENLHKRRIVTYSRKGNYQQRAGKSQQQYPWIVCHGLELPSWRKLCW